MRDVNDATAVGPADTGTAATVERRPGVPGVRSTEMIASSSARRLRVVNAAARRLATPRYDTEPLEIRRTIDRLARLQPPPRGVSVRRASVAGVPGEWIVPKVCTGGDTVLYLHGGGYIAGGSHTHRALVGALVRRCGRPTFVPDYRLAPEHRHPAALDDARAVYTRLIADIEANRSGHSLVVAGDSAGGGLATALLVDRRDAGVRMPDRLALISPWVDLSGPLDETVEARAGLDVVMRADQIRAAGLAYAEDRIADPSASPLWADLAGLPPTLIQVGSAELLGAEGELLAHRMGAAGVSVALEVWQHMPHVFHTVPVLKERRSALDRLAAFMAGSDV